ncbi:MAG: acyl-CoA reductase [Myxococcota bacterium]
MTAGDASDPEAVARAAARLREAGAALRARSRSEVTGALSRWLERWCTPESPWQAELAGALAREGVATGPTLRAGLALGLGAWQGAPLASIVDAELSPYDSVSGFDLTGVVLAGSIPMPSLLSLLWPLALGSPVLVKTASRDPVTARLAARTLAEVDPLLGRCVSPAAFDRDAQECHRVFAEEVDCLVATGSDQAVEAWAARTRPPRRFVGFGHRLSLAALGPAADAAAAARDLAVDVALWDQQGCLSPVAVYVVGREAVSRSAELALALGAELAAAEDRWPRAAAGPGAAALAAHERAEAEMRRAAGRAVDVVADAEGRWCVVAEDDAAPRPAPLDRFVRIHPVDDLDALWRAIRPFAAHLAGAAVAGFDAGLPEVARGFASLGASRVCAPGRLQAPPIDWHHDGRPLLLPLARIHDRETP